MKLVGRHLTQEEPSIEELATLLLTLGQQLLANAADLGECNRAELEENLAVMEASLARKQGKKPN